MARLQTEFRETWEVECPDCHSSLRVVITRERGGPIADVDALPPLYANNTNRQTVSNLQSPEKEDTVNGRRIRGKHSP